MIGLNNGGGSYGPRVVYPDGHQEFYAVMGSWTKDETGQPTFGSQYLETIIHEFNHSFINPLVNRVWGQFSATDEIYRAVANQMKSQEYGSAETMVDESLVRAGVILYFESKASPVSEINRRIHREEANGFLWMDGLCALLRQYRAQRDRYPALSDFMPQVEEFFSGLAPRIPDELAAFRKASVQVVSVQPMVDGAQGVDPSLKEIVIAFDQALDPAKGYSINVGPGGKEHFPITGTPVFLPGNQSIKLAVELKPHWDYSFTLTPRAFVSPEGYPLESYTVSFQTR